MARHDFGLSDEEFGELTPGEFRALCKRRNVRIRYERYAHALTASAVYNVNRHSADDPIISAFDFVRDEEASEKREHLLKAKRFVKKVIGGMPIMTPMEKLLEKRLAVIADLKASGYKDGEAIFDECFPHLKPKEDECQK
jgi:hypothetical protein